MKLHAVLFGLFLTTAAQAVALDNPNVPNSMDQRIFESVSQPHLIQFLRDMTGTDPVTVFGQTYSIKERYSPASKAKYRNYLVQYFQSLGMKVQVMPYGTQHKIGEQEGHNVEAVLDGQSKDSIIVIVHYDSIGPSGHETDNAGVDDDMTGMAVSLETARILSQYKGRLQHTIRFVAADYEEMSNPGLEGARTYAKYIQALATRENFKIISAVDNEQSGWNCAHDGQCGFRTEDVKFDVFSCDGNSYDYAALGDSMEALAAQFSTLKVKRDCMGQNSDHYAMWEIGVPAVVYSEDNPFGNNHFDSEGGDTFDKIDQDYFFKIAQIGVTYAAKQVGITP